MVKREPTRVRVGVRYGPAWLELPAGNKNSKMVSRLVGQYHMKDKLLKDFSIKDKLLYNWELIFSLHSNKHECKLKSISKRVLYLKV